MSNRGPWAAFGLVAAMVALFLALPVGVVAVRSLMGAAGQGAGFGAWVAAFSCKRRTCKWSLKRLCAW